MRLVFYFLMLAYGLSACDRSAKSTSQQIPTSDITIDTLHNFLKGYYDVMSSRKWLEYRNFFWDNATLTTAWQPPGASGPRVAIITIDEFITQTPQGPDSKPIFEEKMTSAPEIQITNNIAVAKAAYEVKFGTKDTLMKWKGLDVFTLMRHNGKWKIVSVVYE